MSPSDIFTPWCLTRKLGLGVSELGPGSLLTLQRNLPLFDTQRTDTLNHLQSVYSRGSWLEGQAMYFSHLVRSSCLFSFVGPQCTWIEWSRWEELALSITSNTMLGSFHREAEYHGVNTAGKSGCRSGLGDCYCGFGVRRHGFAPYSFLLALLESCLIMHYS